MKKVLLLTGLVLSLASFGGCNSCRQMTCGWFNRGDKCGVCPPPDCGPGGPRANFMLPGTPQVLPGPIEIAPQQ